MMNYNNRIRSGYVIGLIEVYPGICLKELRKTTKNNIFDVAAEM
jgi:hypothetical protein